MKAYVLNKSGNPDVLKVREVPEPTPGEGEVKVKIITIGLNYAEILSRRGQYSWAPKRPYIPGMEAYGEIVELGSECRKFSVGEKVILGQQYGCYAEYSCVSEKLCFEAFEQYTPEENAAFLVNFMTAWIALRQLCKLEEKERVLIHAAAGGVGTAAVQLASKMGGVVYGTASKPEKLTLIKSLGADKAVDYAKEDFYEVIMNDGGKVDVILEVVGGEVFKKSMRLLAPFGRIAVIGFASINLHKWNPFSWWKTYKDAPKANLMAMAKKSVGIFASHIGYLTNNAELSEIVFNQMRAFVVEKDIKPVVGKVYDFSQLPDAHLHIQSRNSVGKVVIRVSE